MEGVPTNFLHSYISLQQHLPSLLPPEHKHL